ncbi:hypothetical protein GCK32_000664 [Trichostrongylus colubriformis]|uniref:DEP domain-containing protein n=1 Tax=Trichostrongylus colubriformis TaxID=6319 RepID=A0AAN8IRU2_TRICO
MAPHKIPHYVSTTSTTSSSRSSCAINYGIASTIKRDEISDEGQLLMTDGDDPIYADFVSAHPTVREFGQGRLNTYLLDGLPEYEEILNLPGLKESPDLMKRLDELCLKPRSSIIATCGTSSESVRLPDLSGISNSPSGFGSRSSQTPSCTHMMSTLDEECSPRPPESLLEALSLVLLSLPPSRRRKLHYLIRFMNKIAANHCLQLDELHSNREEVLRGLSKCIVSLQGSPLVTAMQRAQLMTILLDYEKKVFTVPKVLLSEVEEAIRERQREKVMPTEQAVVKKPIAKTNDVQFCNSIRTREYEERNQRLDQNLLELLDQICCDENLSVVEKRKRLRKFKKTYPVVYSQRFPSPELTQSRKKEKDGSLFSRFFGR